MLTPEEATLFTDLYELTMLQSYVRHGMHDEAVFDLFVRTLPERRNFLVAGGLDDVLRYLEGLRFDGESLDYLRSLEMFDDAFLAYLRDLRFTGSVRALQEGTPVFGEEPILEVTAPLPEAQLIETYLLNQVSFQTMIAAKGVRTIAAARGLPVIDFGARRMHGTDAAMKAARMLYMVGFASTSNVLAGKRYGIPVAGTMAHSYIEAHDSEMDAFRDFARDYPATILLVDTYDTLGGVRKVVDLARELGDAFHVSAVRLDSGDLVELPKRARRILDDTGLRGVGIVVSGGLDEYAVERMLELDAPIAAIAVGTNVGVSADAPKVDSAYKLVAYAGSGRMKLSTDKITLPGAKQVYRRFEGGVAAGDTIGLPDETGLGEPLLVEVMRDGKRLPAGDATLEQSREHARAWVAALPDRLRWLTPAEPPYEVAVSDALRESTSRLHDELRRR